MSFCFHFPLKKNSQCSLSEARRYLYLKNDKGDIKKEQLGKKRTLQESESNPRSGAIFSDLVVSPLNILQSLERTFDFANVEVTILNTDIVMF